MGIIKDITVDAISRIEQAITGTTSTEQLFKFEDRTPAEKLSEELLSKPDKELLGVDAEQFEALKDAPIEPEITLEYPNLTTPAVLRTEGQIEEEDIEELEEADILAASKRNRLRINLTGGVSTPTAGVGTKAPTQAGTGLKVG